MAKVTTTTVAIVRRLSRARSRIRLPTLDAPHCLIGGSADQLKWHRADGRRRVVGSETSLDWDNGVSDLIEPNR